MRARVGELHAAELLECIGAQLDRACSYRHVACGARGLGSLRVTAESDEVLSEQHLDERLVVRRSRELQRLLVRLERGGVVALTVFDAAEIAQHGGFAALIGCLAPLRQRCAQVLARELELAHAVVGLADAEQRLPMTKGSSSCSPSASASENDRAASSNLPNTRCMTPRFISVSAR